MKPLLVTLGLLAGSGFLLLEGGAAQARQPGSPRSRAPRWPVVAGLDGQVDLVLDRGRSLSDVPLGRARGGWPRLGALEKARLDARRIAFASSLSQSEQLLRIAAIVQHRFPFGTSEGQRYSRVSEAQRDRQGSALLSKYVQRRAGLCRERAWLLHTLLEEVGVRARVRYGELYDGAGNDLGGHAWVEVRLEKQRLLLDPSRPDTLHSLTQVLVEESLPDSSTRRVRAAITPGLTYVPTKDLRVAPARRASRPLR
jgi:hypothetical protein